ncbi:hypothetical protein JTE90_007734 [Oedothorax gibbosus]|uniref:Uncharacterized protein n=1 Tax=Oedothorax gibbosus TaxID=931172 RepID=A0AAV6V7T9_9ARAC|nr:hypothetical protein JTE90_007734 [Oedothorax gibbosus]
MQFESKEKTVISHQQRFPAPKSAKFTALTSVILISKPTLADTGILHHIHQYPKGTDYNPIHITNIHHLHYKQHRRDTNTKYRNTTASIGESHEYSARRLSQPMAAALVRESEAKPVSSFRPSFLPNLARPDHVV